MSSLINFVEVGGKVWCLGMEVQLAIIMIHVRFFVT